MKRVHNEKKGFTLVELIIVVAIIAVLAAVVVPSIIKFLGVGQKAAAQGEMNAVQIAIYAAMAESGVAAVDISGPLSATNATTSNVNISGGLQGGMTGLKGIWTINSSGVIVFGDYPNPANLATGATYWEYDSGNWTQKQK